MLVLEPNGTLVMYCGMVKVCFAGSIFAGFLDTFVQYF